MIIEKLELSGDLINKEDVKYKNIRFDFHGFLYFFYDFFFFFFFFFKKGNLKDTLMVSATQPSLHC